MNVSPTNPSTNIFTEQKAKSGSPQVKSFCQRLRSFFNGIFNAISKLFSCFNSCRSLKNKDVRQIPSPPQQPQTQQSFPNLTAPNYNAQARSPAPSSPAPAPLETKQPQVQTPQEQSPPTSPSSARKLPLRRYSAPTSCNVSPRNCSRQALSESASPFKPVQEGHESLTPLLEQLKSLQAEEDLLQLLRSNENSPRQPLESAREPLGKKDSHEELTAAKQELTESPVVIKEHSNEDLAASVLPTLQEPPSDLQNMGVQQLVNEILNTIKQEPNALKKPTKEEAEADRFLFGVD